MRGKLVALTVAGMGREAARRAAAPDRRARPRWVLSAGFGGALNPALARYEIVLPGEVIDLEGQHFATDLSEAPKGQAPRYATGRLLTVDQIIRTASEKAELYRRFAADLVDMETSGVAEVCRDRVVKFLPIRVISDEAQADLPPEVVALLTRTGSYRLSAALLRRLASAVEREGSSGRSTSTRRRPPTGSPSSWRLPSRGWANGRLVRHGCGPGPPITR